MKKFPVLYKRTQTGNIQEWSICVDGDSYFTVEGVVGGKLTTSKPTVCETKNEGRSNERLGSAQAISEAQAKWKKQKEKGYTEDKSNVDSVVIDGYKPMLAHSYDDHKDSVTFPCFGQTKLDGIRCLMTSTAAWSRNGKPILMVPHIQEALKPFFKKHPNAILDGELYNHELHDNFNKIASLVKKTRPSLEDIFEAEQHVIYFIYDAPRIGKLTEKDPFSERSALLNQELTMSKHVQHLAGTGCIHLVETVVIKTEKDISATHDKFVEQGYEGLMLRLDKPYQNKRSRFLLKVKQFQDDEFPIVDIQSGRGNKADMAAHMFFRTKQGKPFSAGIIGDETFCRDILNRKELFIGTPATVKFFNWTPDGLPRFPKVLRIRDYE